MDECKSFPDESGMMRDSSTYESTSIYKAICDKYGSCFKCDLMKESISHVKFLRGMHRLGHSWRTWTSESSSSFRRYAEIWLPLVAKCHEEGKGQQLVPPPDIAWIWHCHRLAPKAYLNHTRETFGLDSDQYLEANPPFEFQERDQEEDEEDGTTLLAAGDVNNHNIKRETRILWEKLYPHEPFFIDINGHNSNDNNERVIGVDKDTIEEVSLGMLSGYHVLASCERQSTFLYQVSQPRFAYFSFIEEAVINYARFLYLRSTESGRKVIIVPTYQIDLMWHTHILSSLEYYDRETIAIMGHLLHHDDSMNDRSSGSSLEVAFKATIKLWKATYNEPFYHCPGGMYRGEPPSTYWSPHWPQENPLKFIASSWEDANKKFSSVHDESVNIENSVHGKLKDDLDERMILGYGRLGKGLYSLDTKEGIMILLRRIAKRCKNRTWYCYHCPNSIHRFQEICFPSRDTDGNSYRQHNLIESKIRWAFAYLLTFLFATLPYLLFILLDPILWKYDNLRIFVSTLAILDGPPEDCDGMSLPKLHEKWRECFNGDDESGNICSHIKLSKSLLKKFPG